MSERLLTFSVSSQKQTIVCQIVMDIKDRIELNYDMFLPLLIKNTSLKFFIPSDWFCKNRKAFYVT